MVELTARSSIRWLSEYAVGVPEIDEEHRRLFTLAEKLHRAMYAGNGPEVLEHLLDELLEYTSQHFAHEEKLMDRIRYPYIQKHHREHEEVRLKVRILKSRADAGETTMTVEAMMFLMNWLKCHTTTSDRRIGSYMRNRGLV